MTSAAQPRLKFVVAGGTELVFKSRRVVPARLLESRFTFRHPAWPQAADDLCRAWREERQARTPC